MCLCCVPTKCGGMYNTYMKCFGEPAGIAVLGKEKQQAVGDLLLFVGGWQSAVLNTCHQFGEI